MISIDFETYLISAEEPIPKPVCLSYYSPTEKGIVTGRDDMEVYLYSILTSGQTIIAHNMRFEALVIDYHFPKLRSLLYSTIAANTLVCTKVYEQLLDNIRKKPLYSFSLDKLVANYFDVDISEDKKDPNSWRLRYSELDGVPLEEWPLKAKEYALADSEWAYKVYLEQLKIPMDIHLSVAADIYLNKMGLYGIQVDLDRVATLESEVKSILMPKYRALEDKNIVQHGKKKVKIFRELLGEHIKNLEYTAKGVISISSESLEHYLAEESPVSGEIQDYLDIMKYEKVLTSFVSRLKTANPYIRTNYKSVVSSGRTSSSTDPNYPSVNIQQMPRTVDNVTYSVRNCFMPRSGYKIVSIDYAGLELSSTAYMLWYLTGKRDMLDTINSGNVPKDMHSNFAYRIFNLKEKQQVNYEEFVANKKKSPFSAYRQLAKPINLGFPGGIGYDTMRSLLAREGIYPKLVVLETAKYENTLTWKRSATRKQGYPTRIRQVARNEFQLVYDELVSLKQELFSLYPDLEYFLNEGHKEFLTGQTKPVKDEFGDWTQEPMYSFEVNGFKRDWCMYTQLCNGILMQSPSAIGAKKATVKLMEMYGNSPAVHMLAFIHDEIVFEVLETADMPAIIKDVSEVLIDEMQNVLPRVRITVEAEVFDYWAKSGGFYEATYWKDSQGDNLNTY